MKTIKKVFLFLTLVCFFGGILVSCDDDCGCDPRIDYIITSGLSNPEDSLIVSSSSGSTIIIVGENLGSVIDARFGNIPAALNSSFITDNSIILQVPSTIESTTTDLTLTTAQGRKLVYAFAVNIPAPVIEMFYSEFVEAGDVFRIKGKYFFSPKVYFYDEEGNEVEAKVTESTSTEVKVIVPDKAYHSKPIKMVTQAGTSISKIRFRDKRNIIIDFDEIWGRSTSLLTPGEPFTWRDEFIGFAGLFDLPEKGCDGWYGAINQIGYVSDGGYLSTDPDRANKKNLLGEFIAEGVNNLVLKFEIYVPKESPINGVSTNIYITPSNFGGVTDLGRSLTKNKGTDCVPGAFWHPFQLRIDKSDDTSWEVDKTNPCAKEFSTDGWMTVAVPLSDFKWNISQYGVHHALKTLGIPEALADRTSLDLSQCYEFAFLWNPQDNKQEGSFIAFFDNFRIVPEDGGGAVLNKIGERIRYY